MQTSVYAIQLRLYIAGAEVFLLLYLANISVQPFYVAMLPFGADNPSKVTMSRGNLSPI